MNLIMPLCRAIALSVAVFVALPLSAQNQYNMSLEDKTAVGPTGSVAHPAALAVDRLSEIDQKAVTRVAEGIYRLGGWGIASTIAVEGPEGWIIVDAGDSLEAATEQRQWLERKVGPIEVAAVLYTHSHYIWGAKAFQDENTQFFAHEQLMNTLRGDNGVSVLAGNFSRRAAQQFGILHPAEGPDSFPNSMGFGIDKLTGTKAMVPPTITFEDDVIETHQLAGLTVEVLPSKTDVVESVAFYFPSKKLLVSNALGSSTEFNLYTLRGDWYRDPMDFVEAADFALTRDIEYQVDIHGPVYVGKDVVISSLQTARDQMQLIHDQTYRAIALGKDAQEAAEWIYMPNRKGNETHGQVESHVKRVYGARLGWMGNDPYDINPLAKSEFSQRMIDAMGGADAVLLQAQKANAKRTLEDWQWALYLTSQLLISDAANAEAKAVRAEAARSLGQRTSSANARGFYISEALLHDGNLKFGEHSITSMEQLNQAFGIETKEKLASSPLDDNVQYIRYMVDTRKAEGLNARFIANFGDEGRNYAIALRNGVIAITHGSNDGPVIDMTKEKWGELILKERSFSSLHHSLAPFDLVIAE